MSLPTIQHPHDGQPALKPFLKWAGGKRQLLPHLRRFYPSRFHGYFEPFVGSGAVFCDLWNLRLISGARVVLMDSNADLVGCFRTVRDDVETLIRRLSRLAKDREKGIEAHYYLVRDMKFNRLRRRLLGDAGRLAEAYGPELAAMLIYLNRTGYNGLFRLNADGLFNVPVGRYENPRICDGDNLRLMSCALAASRAEIVHAQFSHVLSLAGPGDFVYFDPPYAPMSPTAAFTSYTARGFGEREQVELQQVAVELARRGCHVVLSNSTAPLVERLYECDDARRAGLRAYKVPARRSINSVASKRGAVLEYVIANTSREEMS